MTGTVSPSDGILLLKLARENILRGFGKENDDLAALKVKASTLVLKGKRGVFVSLHKRGDLRGCIGNIEPVKTIWEGVMDNARHAAFKDSRFQPLSHRELEHTTIEVSILSRPEKIEYTDAGNLIEKLRPDIDGVIISRQNQRATFLPQVWQQLKDPKSFLTQLCMKAGLSSTEWQSGNLDVHTYQVQLFEEGFSDFS